jgi:hypothetical protein
MERLQLESIELADVTHEYRWRNSDGRLLKKSEVNLHHVAHNRAWYKSKVETRYRNMGGFILPMEVSWHDELHASVKPPLKPKRPLMDMAIEYGSFMDSENVYTRFNEFVSFFIDVSNNATRPNVADQALRIGNNLQLQQAFVEKGSVTRL